MAILKCYLCNIFCNAATSIACDGPAVQEVSSYHFICFLVVNFLIENFIFQTLAVPSPQTHSWHSKTDSSTVQNNHEN